MSCVLLYSWWFGMVLLCWWRVFLGADHRTWSSQCWWHSTMKPKLPFSARHPAAPFWLESPDVTLCAADSTSVSVRECHIFRCLLEMSAWYICVCQLFQCANFSGSFYHSLYQNSSAFCLVWMLGEPSERHPGKKVFELVLLKSSFLRGGCSIISATRGATEVFIASCWI